MTSETVVPVKADTGANELTPAVVADSPNAVSRQAMQELREGKGQRSNSLDALMKDLGI